MDTMLENKVVPELRFREFNDSWSLKTLNDLTKLITKGTTPKSFTLEGINFVKIEGLVGTHINKEKCLHIDEKTHLSSLRRSILKNNDIIFAIAGATIGKVGIVTDDILPANTNQALSIIRLANIDNLSFILQILQSSLMKKYIYKNISVGAQPNLSLKQVNDFSFFIPTLNEQQKIASFLSAVDEKIQQLTKKKELLEDYKKGIMQKIFSQEIRFKDDNGNNYPNWEEKELANVFDVVSGKSKSKYLSNNGDYVLVDMGGISSFPRLIANKKTDYCGDFLTTNDLVMPKDDIGGGFIIGKVVGIPKNNKYICGDHVFKLTIKSGHILYFKYAINSFIINKSLRIKANGTAQIGLRKGDVENQILFVPHIQEQKKIANFLSSIDKKIDLVSTQIEKTKEFKKGLLQQMFV